MTTRIHRVASRDSRLYGVVDSAPGRITSLGFVERQEGSEHLWVATTMSGSWVSSRSLRRDAVADLVESEGPR